MDTNTLQQIRATFKEAFTQGSVHSLAFGDSHDDTTPVDVSPLLAIPAVRFDVPFNYGRNGLTKKDCTAILKEAVEDTISVSLPHIAHPSLSKWYFARTVSSCDIHTVWHIFIVPVYTTLHYRVDCFGVQVDFDNEYCPAINSSYTLVIE